MRKIFYLVALCCAFASCDKTENEQNLVNLFTGNSSPALTHYDSIDYVGVVDPKLSYWKEDSDAYATYENVNGIYKISAKQDFYIWNRIELDNNRDFQFEIKMEIILNASLNDKRIGMIFGVADKSFHFFTLMNTTDDVHVVIGKVENNTITYLYKRQSLYSGERLFTVRKVENKISFFLNQSYLYTINYDKFANNYGFVLPRYGVINVHNIKIDYISPKND